MRNKTRKPFIPFVSLEQVLSFDAGNEATATPSRLVNSVLEAFQTQRLMSVTAVGEYLELAPAKLSAAIEIATGMKFSELRDSWVRIQAARLQDEHPGWGSDELAQALGYADRSALWNIMHRSARKSYYRDVKKTIADHQRLRAGGDGTL